MPLMAQAGTTPKVDYSPLLVAGIQDMTMTELGVLTVDPFSSSIRRPLLFSNLTAWLSRAIQLGLKGELWVDGSFTTEKSEPNDIDCVLIIDKFPPSPSSTTIQNIQLHLDKSTAASAYLIDLYIVNRAYANQYTVSEISYWRGWYGFCRDGKTAKGIARIRL